MSDESLTRSKLSEMAKLSLFSGRISSIHEKNLKTFPLIFFDNVDTVTVPYDFSSVQIGPNKTGGKVSYHINFKKETEHTNLEKRLKALEIAVRELFWSDITVEVYFDEKQVFKSK